MTLSTAAVHAQPAEIRVSLAEAIARGLEASNRVGELDARREATEAGVQTARAGTLPQVTLQGGYTRTNHVDPFVVREPGAGIQVLYPDVPDNFRSRLDAQWLLYSGGRLGQLTNAARAEAEAGARDVAAVRSDVRLEITRAYWNLVTAREAVRVVEESVRRVEAHLADAKARFDAGLVPPNDVTSAEAQRALQESTLIESRNAAAVANLTLARLLGTSADIMIVPAETLESTASAQPDVASLVATARSAREDRRALESRASAAASRVLAARAGSRPSLAVAGGLDYARPNPRIFPRIGEWRESWDASVNAAWPLFDGGRVKADVATAEANERALRKRLDDLDSLIELEVRQRALDVQSSVARVPAADAAVRAAADSRRVLQDRFTAGVATSTEVLDAQVLLLDAELRRTLAYAAVRVAQAGLARAIGQ